MLLDFNNPTTQKLLYTITTLFTLFIIYKYLLKFLHKKIDDVQKYYKTRKNITYIYFLTVLVISFFIWFEGFNNFSTYFGLLSAGIAIALKDFITNFGSFLFIIFRKPFEVGDRIEIDGVAGDVIDQRPFQFTIMEIGNWVHADQSTGRIIHIPNNRILIHPIANYSKGFSHIWNELEVLITFESDWKKAKIVLENIAETFALDFSRTAEEDLIEASKKFMIFYNNLTPIVYTSVQSDGVLLTLRYLTNPRARRSSSEKLWEEILEEFEKEQNIQLAYKTMRIIK